MNVMKKEALTLLGNTTIPSVVCRKRNVCVRHANTCISVTPSTTNLEGQEILDAPGKDGNASMPEQVKRPNPCKKIIIIIIIIHLLSPIS
jgi:hypothetical protein